MVLLLNINLKLILQRLNGVYRLEGEYLVWQHIFRCQMELLKQKVIIMLYYSVYWKSYTKCPLPQMIVSCLFFFSFSDESQGPILYLSNLKAKYKHFFKVFIRYLIGFWVWFVKLGCFWQICLSCPPVIRSPEINVNTKAEYDLSRAR